MSSKMARSKENARRKKEEKARRKREEEERAAAEAAAEGAAVEREESDRVSRILIQQLWKKLLLLPLMANSTFNYINVADEARSSPH